MPLIIFVTPRQSQSAYYNFTSRQMPVISYFYIVTMFVAICGNRLKTRKTSQRHNSV